MPEKIAKTNPDQTAKFHAQLTHEYRTLFNANDPRYSPETKKMEPAVLAERMVAALERGTGNKDGEGIKRTCKALGIPYTYKGIKAYFQS